MATRSEVSGPGSEEMEYSCGDVAGSGLDASWATGTGAPMVTLASRDIELRMSIACVYCLCRCVSADPVGAAAGREPRPLWLGIAVEASLAGGRCD